MRGFRSLAITTVILSLLSFTPRVQAEAVRHISASQAEGKGGSFPTITV